MPFTSYQMQAQGKCNGTLEVPGDKSISHRAIMLASLAQGVSEVKGFLPSTDCEATLAAFQSMSVEVERVSATCLRIHGVGLHGLQLPKNDLDMGNSGTAMRLMAGVLCGQKFASVLTGDESLSARPMQRIQEPLLKMQADISMSSNGTPPLVINKLNNNASQLVGINYQLPVASAQVKSCLLLAGLYAQGETCIEEKAQTRDHTERMLQSFAYPIKIEQQENSKNICIQGGNALIAANITIPADISSAAFFIVGALISKAGKLELKNIGINPTRNGVIEILRLMGADIELKNEKMFGVEPVADVVVRSSKLKGIQIPTHLISNAIDEFPIIFIAAACANGVTELSDAEELRVKESDRIHNMAVGLSAVGIEVREKADGIKITGGRIKGGEVDSGGDHRVAMSFAIASVASEQAITILNTENVATSFPEFVASAKQVGLEFC